MGPLSIQVWGLCVAAGMAIGLLVARWVAGRWHLDQAALVDVAFWILVSSLVGGRVLYVLTELPMFVGQPWWQVLAVWQGGMSITGGFIGAGVAGWWGLRRRQLPFFTYTDALIIGLPFGLAVGRLGCAFIFDHPGVPTTFFLGQMYVDGIVRHNHGLYLALSGAVLSVLMVLLLRRFGQWAQGRYVSVFLLWYGVVRFAVDFLRAYEGPVVDPRWFGLTPAQYVACGMVVAGLALWYHTNHYGRLSQGEKVSQKGNNTE